VWLPTDVGLVAWTYDSALMTFGFTPAGGRIYLVGLKLAAAANVSKLYMYISAVVTGLTSGQNLMGLYDPNTGNRLGLSVDCTSSWGATGLKPIPLTSTVPLPAGVVWVAMLCNGTQAATNLWGQAGGGVAGFGVASGSTLRNGIYSATTQTALPASIVPANVSTVQGNPWVGAQT
jgi:hypothetical protein